MSSRLLRFGTFKDRPLYQKFRENYDLLAINGNICAYNASATASLLGPGGTLNCPYFIDPQTHAFQHDFKFLTVKRDGESFPKRSLKSLSEKFGGIVSSSFTAQEPITPDLFGHDEILELSRSALTFQRTIVSNSVSDEIRHYLDYANIRDRRPAFVVAPYFYIDKDNADEWLNINVELGKSAINQREANEEIWLQLVLSRKLLVCREFIASLVDAYRSISSDGILIWIDDFVETDVSEEELDAFVNLLLALKKDATFRIFNLYGGFFSICLSHAEIGLLNGICNGLEYGQDRKITPVGGGIPVAKYYFPRFHKRYDFSVLRLNLLDPLKWDNLADFKSEVCQCSECNTTLGSDFENIELFNETQEVDMGRFTRNFPTEATKLRSLKHFMAARQEEFDMVSKTPLNRIVQILRSDYESHPIVKKWIPHLSRWANVLERTHNSLPPA